MKMRESKQAVRREAAGKLRQYSEQWIMEESRKIQEYVLKSKEYMDAGTIFCYVSFGREVSTALILEDAWKAGKTVGVPLCIQKGIMEVRKIRSMDDLVPGAYGIPEPKADTEKLDGHDIQYGIIPCVTCDRNGNRMGHGAGYYDRYLAGTDFVKAVLCFEEILAEEVPMDAHDVRMDNMITQSGIKKVNQ